jgi:hypothetical protein
MNASGLPRPGRSTRLTGDRVEPLQASRDMPTTTLSDGKRIGESSVGEGKITRMRRPRGEALEVIEPPHEDIWQTLGRVSILLAGDTASAEGWSGLGRQLRDQCGRMASATYCLHEWSEPDDSRSDRAARQRKLALNGVPVPSVKTPDAR